MCVVMYIRSIYFPDPRGAGLQEAIQFLSDHLSVCLSVRPSVHPSKFGLFVFYMADITRTPLTLPMGGLKYLFLVITFGPF